MHSGTSEIKISKNSDKKSITSVNVEIPLDIKQNGIINPAFTYNPEDNINRDFPNIRDQISKNNIYEIKPQEDEEIVIQEDKKHVNFNNQPSESSSQVKPKWKNFIGVFFALMSTIFFSLLFVTIKLIPSIHPITQSIWRYGVYTILNILVISCMTFYKPSADEQHPNIFKYIWPDSNVSSRQCWATLGKLVAAGAVGCAGTLLESTALNYMTVADATTVTYISLVYVLILAHVFIGERCSIISSVMAFLIIIGIAIISRPPFLTGAAEFNSTLVIGLCIKLIDALCTAIYVICIRHFRHLHYTCLSFIIGTVGLTLAIISSFSLQLFTWPSDLSQVGLLVGLGILHFFANMSVILALRFEKVGPVTLLRTANVPLVFLWQFLILHLLPDEWTILGSSIVCFAVIVTSIRKWIDELPEKSELRQKLWFCLK